MTMLELKEIHFIFVDFINPYLAEHDNPYASPHSLVDKRADS